MDHLFIRSFILSDIELHYIDDTQDASNGRAGLSHGFHKGGTSRLGLRRESSRLH